MNQNTRSRDGLRKNLRQVAVSLAVIAAVIAAPTAAAATASASQVAPQDVNQTNWVLQSPNGTVKADIALTAGLLNANVLKGSTQAVAIKKLGVSTSVADLSTNIVVTGQSTRSVTENYTMVTGKQLQRSAVHNELRLNATAAGHNFVVTFRASNDGIAYNYELPATLGNSYTVAAEPAKFGIVGSASAWLQPFLPWYENEHIVTTSAGAPNGTFGYPATFRPATDTYVLLTDSNVTGTYAGTHLTHQTGQAEYGLELYNNVSVKASGALTTPWRLAIVGSAAELVKSTLVDDLAGASKLTDTSWIKTGVSAWAWNTNRDGNAMGSLDVQKRFVDMAVKHGWTQYVIDEGWKEAWIPDLIKYANARGVDINVWFHNNKLQTAQQRKEWFGKLKNWGAIGIKVDFMESDSQDTFKWYDDILADTAKYKLAINFHGSTIPRGLQRTWPQIVSYEGVRGEENLPRSAVRDTIIPFTRNVVGSADFTPTVFSNNPTTTKAHEVGEAIVFESGVQHLADDTSSYATEPIATRFLENLKTVWDQTEYVSGAPGESAVLARRSGDQWFIGGVWASTDQAQKQIPLQFLGSGNWIVDLVTDNGANLTSSTVTATQASALTVAARQNGGFAALACPATAGRTSCLEAPTPITPTAMLAATNKSIVTTGQIVALTGVFTVGPGGPVTDVEISPLLPASWEVVSGSNITRSSLATGETVKGTWMVRVADQAVQSKIPLSVKASYTSAGGRQAAAVDTVFVEAPTKLLPSGTTYISDLPFETFKTGYGDVARDKDLGNNPINIGPNPTTYPKGLTIHAIGYVDIRLNGLCTQFISDVGLEPGGQTSTEGSITFEVLGDGTSLKTAGTNAAPFRADTPAQTLTVDVTGVQILRLKVDDGGNYINNDHGAWGGARVICQPGPPADVTAPVLSVSTSPALPAPSGWFVAPVVVSVTATDDSGEAPSVAYTLGGGEWSDYSAPVTLNDGVYQLEVQGIDASANTKTTEVQQIKVDSAAPRVTSALDESSRIFSLAATDDTSGVATLEYRIGQGAWTAYTVPVTVGSGVAVYSRATDKAGNAGVGQTQVAPGNSSPGDQKAPTVLIGAAQPSTVVFGKDSTLSVRVSATSVAPAGSVNVTGARTAKASGGTTAVVLGGKLSANSGQKGGTRTASASVKLPRNLAVGTHNLVVSYPGTATLAGSVDIVTVKVVKAKPGKVTVTAKKAKKQTRPTISVKVAKLTNGQQATGKVQVRVGSKVVKTVKLTKGKKGKVNVKLPKRYSKSFKVSARFVSTSSQVSNSGWTKAKVVKVS